MRLQKAKFIVTQHNTIPALCNSEMADSWDRMKPSWKQLSLDQLYENFLSVSVDTISVYKSLSDDNLVSFGLTRLVDKVRIREEIRKGIATSVISVKAWFQKYEKASIVCWRTKFHST